MQAPDTTILDWLIDLVQDPDRLAQLLNGSRAEAETLLKEEGRLTNKQIEVVLSRDPLKIQHVIEYESDLEEGAMFMHLTFPIPMHILFTPTQD